MKTSVRYYITIVILTFLVITSCRKEEIEIIQPPEDNVVEANSTISNLLQRVALNDGSIDNILDKGNCLQIDLPVTVSANGTEITVESLDDLTNVEDILDQFDDDADTVDLSFPITLTTSEFNTLTVNSTTELNALIANCNGENVLDNDIECIDFQYPITASRFNANSELLDTFTFTNDKTFYNFFTGITSNDVVTIDFPLSVLLADNTMSTINTISELEQIIDNNINSCDEDDDYNYNDDDCNDCTVEQLEMLLASCPLWTVDNLERNINDENYYVGYEFSFANDGSMVADYAIWSYPGTWQASGSGNDIIVTIDVPSLPDCNNDWILHEIGIQNGQLKFDLNLGDDKIRYVNSCDSFDDSALIPILTSDSWTVTNYFDDVDLTSAFNDHVFTFLSNGSLEVEAASVITYGWWSTLVGDTEDLELNMNFGSANYPIEDIINDWDVVSITPTTITLRELDLGDGTEDFLTLQKL